MTTVDDVRALRRTLGRFCTGVTVVSTTAGDAVHAMTANAFTSVSLEPPLVLVSIANRSRMHGILPESGHYGVSVLATDQERLALHFAGQPSSEHDDPFTVLGAIPVVQGAIAQFACDSYAVHEAGDHTLYVGRVQAFTTREGDPLLFHGGVFARVANDPLITSWGW